MIIEIDKLYPGEAALSSEKVKEYSELYRTNQEVKPIELIDLDGLLIVRDGNTRARAWIEIHKSENEEVQDIVFEMNKASYPTPYGKKVLIAVARYYGSGESAFLSMPITTEEDYKTTQKKTQEKILKLQ